jgi:hypothetical protein
MTGGDGAWPSVAARGYAGCDGVFIDTHENPQKPFRWPGTLSASPAHEQLNCIRSEVR